MLIIAGAPKHHVVFGGIHQVSAVNGTGGNPVGPVFFAADVQELNRLTIRQRNHQRNQVAIIFIIIRCARDHVIGPGCIVEVVDIVDDDHQKLFEVHARPCHPDCIGAQGGHQGLGHFPAFAWVVAQGRCIAQEKLANPQVGEARSRTVSPARETIPRRDLELAGDTWQVHKDG